jgi:hypothetical protein
MICNPIFTISKNIGLYGCVHKNWFPRQHTQGVFQIYKDCACRIQEEFQNDLLEDQ